MEANLAVLDGTWLLFLGACAVLWFFDKDEKKHD